MKRKFYSLWPLLLLLIPQVVLAASTVGDSSNPLNFTPPATDVSMVFLNNIFGLVDGVLAGTGSQILGQMFGVFNAAVLSLGGIVLIYTLLVGTMNTANEGEVLGKRWSSIWIPVRSAAGVALLIPKASGYCMMQIFVMWVVVQGVGAADKVWGAALNYLASGGTIIKTTTPVSSTSAMVTVSGDLLTSATCLYGLEYFVKKQRTDNLANGTCTNSSSTWYCKSVPSFSQGIDFVGATSSLSTTSSSGSQKVQIPNFNSSQYPNYATQFNGKCGSVSWTIPDKSTISENLSSATTTQAVNQLVDQAVQARAIAVQQMYLDLSSVGQSIVNNQFTSSTPLPLGQVSDDYTLWQTSETGTAPLLNGTEVKNAVTAYNNLMQPTLNLLSSSFNTDNLNFIPQAYKDGWILAGSYYFNLVSVNTSLSSITSDVGSVTSDASQATKIDSNFGNNKDLAGLVINKNYINQLSDLVGSNSSYNDPTKNTDCTKGSILENYICNASLLQQAGQPGLVAPNLSTTISFSWDSIPTLENQSFSGGKWSIPGDLATFFSDVLITIANAIIVALNGVLDIVVTPIVYIMSQFISLFATGLSTALNNTTNPITSLAQTGGTFINTAVALWMTSAIASVALSAFPTLGAVGLAFVAFFAPVIFLWITVMVSSGIIMAYYVPLVPYILFTYGAIGWFIGVIEAMVAAPIVALGVTHPEGHEAFGKADQAIMLMLNVFLRPAMMVIGLIAGIILSYVAIWLLNAGFSHAVGLTDYAGNATSDGGLIGNQTNIAAMVGSVFVIVLYVTMYMQIVQKAFELINILPDKILRWLSGGFQESLGAESGRMMQETGQSMQSGAQQVAKAGQEGHQAQKDAYKSAKGALAKGKSKSQGNNSDKTSDGGDNPGGGGGGASGS